MKIAIGDAWIFAAVLIIQEKYLHEELSLARSAAFFAAFTAVALAQQVAYLDTKLTPAERAHDLVSRMTLEEKASQFEDWATSIPRLGIPDYQTWNEALHGVARAGYSTVFPQAIGMAATWEPCAGRSMGTSFQPRRAASTTRRSGKAITAFSSG